MTRKTQRAAWLLGVPAAVVALGVLISWVGDARYVTKQELRAETTQLRDERAVLLAKQDSVNREILLRLDCALFSIPKNCRETLGAR